MEIQLIFLQFFFHVVIANYFWYLYGKCKELPKAKKKLFWRFHTSRCCKNIIMKTLWFGASQVALVVKNPPAYADHIRDEGSKSESGRSSGRRHGNLLQFSCLENLHGQGAWQATVHGVAKSQRWLKGFSTHAHRNLWRSGTESWIDISARLIFDKSTKTRK